MDNSRGRASTGGNVTIRINGHLHHIGLSKALADTPIELLIPTT